MSSRRPHRVPAEQSRPARVFVDSGVWLAFFSARDARHEEADTLFLRAAEQSIPLLTTNLVLAEVHRLLMFRVGSAAAGAALARIDASALVTIVFPADDHHRAARTWLAKLADQKISYTDASSFAVMAASRCRMAMSFDHDFWSAGFELWRP